jgi:hypothetical protein
MALEPKGHDMSKNDKRDRRRFSFWLDFNREDDLLVGSLIDDLKRSKRGGFIGAVRDGIRIVHDLRAGRLDALLELYPWVADKLDEKRNKESKGGDDLGEKLDRLEQLLLQSEAPGGLLMSARQNTGGPKSMTMPSFDLPPLDDEDDAETIVIEKSKADGTQAAKNFLASMGALNGM